MKNVEKIEYINSVLIELASGNFDVKCEPTEDKGELDAIIAGVDMLREELKYSTVSTSYLNSIYNGITDMLIILNERDTILQINEAVLESLGYTEDELVGKHIDFIIDSDSKHIFEQLKFEAMSAIKGNNFEFEFRSRNGGEVLTSCSGSVLMNSKYHEQQLMLIAKDISSLKKVQRKLIAKNKELDTFVYKSSHDLKGPLASIIGLTNVATMEIENPDALNYFELIKKSASRLDRILYDLSELARLRNTATKIAKVELQTVIEDVLSGFFLDSKLEGKIQVMKNYEEIYDFFSNDKILTSVFQNLLGNAIKYRKVNYKVQSFILIEITRYKDGVCVIIKDNGIGIKAEKIPRVFEMFERANLSSDGSGLGLYIVKTSLDKINGTIDVESEEGKGATFTVNLPSLKDRKEIMMNEFLDD